MERVFPENERGEEMVAEVTWPVPLPVRRPPKVVEPVPPKLVASVVVPMTGPELLVYRREEVIDVTARLVEVACFKEVLPRTVKVPMVALAEERLVELAVVAKSVVEVALVLVELVEVRLSMTEGRRMVEEAYRAVLNQVGVVVALVEVPYVEVMVQGQAKTLAEVR